MKTPLYEEHLKLGAKMTEFAGWEMPLQYAGIAHEVEVVRTKVGMFDISHMGEFVISGPNALALVQYVTTNDASKLEIGAAQYTLMCDENGCPIDDLIVYRTDEEEYLLIVNASNEQSDFEWITSHNNFGAGLENQSSQTALIAVQGVQSAHVMGGLRPLFVTSMERFDIRSGRIGYIQCRVARTGYTGEQGYEITCPTKDAVDLWSMLMAAGAAFNIEPIGIGARDVLRLEAAYPLYGHELTRETSPVAARLMWVVKPEKGDFIGRDAILRAKAEGPKQILAGLEAIDRCIPRHGSDVTKDGVTVGSITSGTFSPTLGKGIALAYIDKEMAEPGAELHVVTGGRTCACRVVPTPFYKTSWQT